MDGLEALRFLGRVLAPAADQDAVARLRAAISSGIVDWPLVIDRASRHLITPALDSNLAAKGLLEALEEDLRSYFGAAAELNAQRNRRLHAEAWAVVDALNQVGIEPILLKGLANLHLGLYAEPSQRLLSDIDLLVPEARLADAVAALAAVGYCRAIPDPMPEHYHYPPLARPGALAAVELHRHLVGRAHRRALPTLQVIENARPVELNGRRAAVPCPADLVVHNVIHGQLMHLHFWSAEFALRDAYDLILLLRRFDAELDKQQLAARLSRHIGASCSAFYVRSAGELVGEGDCPLPLPRPWGVWLTTQRWRLHERARFSWLQRLSRRLAQRSQNLSRAAGDRRDVRSLAIALGTRLRRTRAS